MTTDTSATDGLVMPSAVQCPDCHAGLGLADDAPFGEPVAVTCPACAAPQTLILTRSGDDLRVDGVS